MGNLPAWGNWAINIVIFLYIFSNAAFEGSKIARFFWRWITTTFITLLALQFISSLL